VKNGVFGDLKAKTCAKPPFFLPFLAISDGCEGLYDFNESDQHHPQAGHSPCQ
jgi:hypothetical protein